MLKVTNHRETKYNYDKSIKTKIIKVTKYKLSKGASDFGYFMLRFVVNELYKAAEKLTEIVADIATFCTIGFVDK